MTDPNDVVASDAELPKKKGFDLSIFLKPVSEVDTSIGKLYLFPLRDSDMRAFNTLSATDHVERTREFLPCIASLSPDYGLKHERVGITREQASSLSTEEIEVVAEAFVSSNGVRSASKGGNDRTPITRAADEPVTAYLDRLMRNEIEEQAGQFKKLREQALGSTHGIFDQVRKASQVLGDTRLEFERLTRASSIPTGLAPSIEAKPLEFNNHMAEYNARLARERSEDREMVRLTGQMTAQSAETLEKLATTASDLLERLDRRDEEAKRTTRIQLWIAVGSVVVSAALAGGSFVQDWRNNKSGDEWQDQVLTELKTVNCRTSGSEVGNVTLCKQLELLQSTLKTRVNTPPPARVSAPKEATKN